MLKLALSGSFNDLNYHIKQFIFTRFNIQIKMVKIYIFSFSIFQIIIIFIIKKLIKVFFQSSIFFYPQ